MTLYVCTRHSDFGRHFWVTGNKVDGLRYCYDWQKCTRIVVPFKGMLQDMANGEFKQAGYAGLTFEEILIKMYGDP